MEQHKTDAVYVSLESPILTSRVETIDTSLVKTTTAGTTSISTQKSILRNLLTTPTQKKIVPKVVTVVQKCAPNSSAAVQGSECMDNHTFYVVIIIGLVISNCILSCLSIQKR